MLTFSRKHDFLQTLKSKTKQNPQQNYLTISL